MARQLVDRQARVLEYLTSGAAIFGEGGDLPQDSALEGVDRGLLDLEARFSHDKRMDKIASVFPRTFELLGGGREAIVQAFARACPPFHIGRIENARQFLEFLCTSGRPESTFPRFVADVAACELACARVRAAEPAGEARAAPSSRCAVRRHPAVVLVRSAHDIRPILENGPGGAAPSERDTPLAVGPRPDSEQPKIVELAAEVFDLLAALDEWTDVAVFGRSREVAMMIGDLAHASLIEVRP